MHKNMIDIQRAAMIIRIDRELERKKKEDPDMYYSGDFDELLDARLHYAELVKQGYGHGA